MFVPLNDKNPLRHIQAPFVNWLFLSLSVVMFVIQMGAEAVEAQHQGILLNYSFIPVVVRDVWQVPDGFMPDQLRFITYVFLHGDWLHLVSNMLFLWVFGDNIEDAMGHLAYFFFYIVCGMMAAGFYMLFHWDSKAPLIGASGAVAGVTVAYLILHPRARIWVLATFVVPVPLRIPAVFILSFWVVSQFIYLFTSANAETAWFAHIGGVFTGALLVVMLKRRSVPLFGRYS